MIGIRSLLARIVGENISRGDRVALLFSGGADSLSVGFAIEDAGGTVSPITFSIDGRETDDLLSARSASDALGWELVEVEISSDLELVREDFSFLIREIGCEKKTQVECAWPFLYVAPVVRELGLSTAFSGIAADGHYGLSKRAMIHYRYPKEAFDEFREGYFSSRSPAGVKEFEEIFSRSRVDLVSPYLDGRVIDLFRSYSWDELNKPKQKNPIVEEYADRFEFLGAGPRKHANLQLVAGIPEIFEGLLETDLNRRSRTRVMDLVRDHVRSLV